MTEKEIYLQTFNNMGWAKFTIKELRQIHDVVYNTKTTQNKIVKSLSNLIKVRRH